MIDWEMLFAFIAHASSPQCASVLHSTIFIFLRRPMVNCQARALVVYN